MELSLGTAKAFVNANDLLVKPAVAQVQIDADAEAVRAAAEKAAGEAGAQGDGVSNVKFSDTTTEPYPDGHDDTSTVGTADATFTAKKPKTTCYMSTKLDNTRGNRSVQNITEEIVSQLSALGADVELTFEVRARTDDGIPPETIRAISENCSTLGIGNFGFGE